MSVKTTNSSPNPYRNLPNVDSLMTSSGSAALIAQYGRSAVLDAVRAALDSARERLRFGDSSLNDASALLDNAAAHLHAQFRPTLRPVINATGIIIHTNLGRAPLSQAAQRAIQDAAANYSTLEFDLNTGKRGSRSIHAEAALRAITGAEAAMVVNNAASALVLILSALAKGKEVILSRGQLVEIGGGFRVPEVMEQGGVRLREVGTTNRTRIDDYERAITPDTALIMRVHASNFKQIGFTENTGLDELAALAHDRGLIALDDLGSGALLDTSVYGLEHEPMAQESLAAGADLVVFSGDKLLGAPQAGIIIGRNALIIALKKHPLARAIRADKLCLAGLAATLDHYRKGEAEREIPVWRMIAMPLAEIEATAARWASEVGGSVIRGQSAVGGGSLPGETLPTALLAVDPVDPEAFTARLRAADPPVIARIQDDRVLFDPRTVLDGQEDALLGAIREAQN